MRVKRFKLSEPPQGAVALITGSGSGIGRCFALRLASMGYDVALVGLSEEPLQKTEQLIESETTGREVRVWTKAIDLSKSDSSEQLIEWCGEMQIEPLVVINNAGMFAFCDTVQLASETIERLITLHCLTLAKLSRHFAKEMSERGEGGYILNMASYSQWMPFPGISLYGASKSFVKGFSVGLAKEVEDRGVVVSAISPAGVATPLYGLPDKLQHLGIKLGALITADRCAKRGLNALSRGRRHIVPDWWNIAFIPICKMMPRFVERWLRKKTMKFQKRV